MFEIYRSLAAWLITLIELMLVISALAMILSRQSSALSSTAFDRIESFFGRLAARRPLSIVALAVLALTIRAALIPLLGIPQPGWHDEFSYLLAGDTFAHGSISRELRQMTGGDSGK